MKALEKLAEYRTDDEKVVSRAFDQIALSKQPVSIRIVNDTISIPSSPVLIDMKRGILALEIGPDVDFNHKMFSTGEIVMEFNSIDTKVYIHLTDVKPAKLKGERVAYSKLPNYIYRVQRREFFRVESSLSDPIPMHYLSTDRGVEYHFSIYDISIGGLCFTLEQPETIQLEEGQLLHDCLICLPPKMENITFDLTIRNIRSRAKGIHTYTLVGCEFTGVQRSTQAAIERCVFRLQSEKLRTYTH